jgi:hypothetical protein
MPELNPDGTVYEIPPPPDEREARLQAIANCTRCDSEGYRNTLVCDHVDHAPAALRGKALVQAESRQDPQASDGSGSRGDRVSQNRAALPPQQATSGSEPPPEGQYTGETVTDAFRAVSELGYGSVGQLEHWTRIEPTIHASWVELTDCGCRLELTAESAPVRAWVCEHGNEIRAVNA